MPDTSGIQSTGGSKAAAFIRAEVNRQLGLAMQQAYYKQQQEIDSLKQQNEALRTEVRQLTEKVRDNTISLHEYDDWAHRIHGHVASVDEKAERLSEISAVLFGIVEILHWPVPILENIANRILNFTKKIRGMEKRKRSRVDGKPLNDLLD